MSHWRLPHDCKLAWILGNYVVFMVCLTGTSKLCQIFHNFKIHFPSVYLFGCLIHLHVIICFLCLCGFSQHKWSLALNLWQISYHSLLNETSKEWQWSVSFAQIYFQEAYQNFCVSWCPGKEGTWQIWSNFGFTFSLSSISQEQASESFASFGKYSENSESLQIFIRISKKSAIIIYSNGQASLSPSIARVEHRAGCWNHIKDIISPGYPINSTNWHWNAGGIWYFLSNIRPQGSTLVIALPDGLGNGNSCPTCNVFILASLYQEPHFISLATK